jgi:hypothetical protein
VGHLSEDCMLVIQAVQLRSRGDVKLGGVHILAAASHAHNAFFLVAQVRPDLVLEKSCLFPIQ